MPDRPTTEIVAPVLRRWERGDFSTWDECFAPSGLEIRESLFIVFRFASDQLVEMHWHPKREGALQAAGLGIEGAS